MTWLVAVDPGIDAAGVACFRLDQHEIPGERHNPPWRAGESFGAAMWRLGPTTVVRTKPEQELVDRLHAIGYRFAAFTEATSRISTILLERPSMPGAYAGKRGRQYGKGMINGAAMEKLYLALGVLVDQALCHSELELDGRVELVPAPRIKKAKRQELVVSQLHFMGHSLVAQGAPRLSPDLLDAIYLGAAWLSDPKRLADVPHQEAVHAGEDSTPTSTGDQQT